MTHTCRELPGDVQGAGAGGDLEPPIPLIRARNAGRTRSVPRRAWDRVFDKLDVPNRSEAHPVDWIVG